jgi:cell division protein FtsQ
VSRAGSTTRDRVRERRERIVGRGGRTAGRSTTAGRRPAGSVTPLPGRRYVLRSPRHRRSFRIAVTVLSLLTVGWLLWFGPVLAVRTVQVDGLDTLPAEEVRRSAGIESGTPLLRVDVEAAEARVAALPQVASVEVTRGWPSTVVVTVQERRPVAVVGEPGRRSLVDAEGMLFDAVSGEPPAGVVPLDVEEPGPGDPATMAGLAAIAALPAEAREEVALATVLAPEEIVLTLTDDTVVHWGSADESAEKAAVLAALIGQLDAGTLEPATEIDVSAPDAVVLR